MAGEQDHDSRLFQSRSEWRLITGVESLLLSAFPPSLRHTPSWTEDIVFLLDEELRLLDVNEKWDTFAMANGGRNLSLDAVRGSSILSYTPEVLRGFYFVKYEAARRSQKPIRFEYDCSSPEKIRLFRMEISSVETSLLVVNHLLLEEPWVVREPGSALEASLYSTADKIVTMCANCRKSRRVDLPETWEWVPEFLLDRGLLVSHGLCPRCFTRFYVD